MGGFVLLKNTRFEFVTNPKRVGGLTKQQVWVNGRPSNLYDVVISRAPRKANTGGVHSQNDCV